MTRVNLIHPRKLYDQHLMAEYREIPMVIASLKRSLAAVDFDVTRLRIPKAFTLNRGHVSFFYDKGEWLHRRYSKCVSELQDRGFDIDPDSRNVDWAFYQQVGLWSTDWKPTKADKAVSRDRIRWKVRQKPGWYRKTKGNPK